MFKAIKLYFTDRPYYKQRKRYMKRQKAVRRKLRKQVNEFCPWSGYYMHEMIKTMLEFYYETYAAGDCCWSESARTGKIANQLEQAVKAAKALDELEDLESGDLLSRAQQEPGFEKWLEKWKKKTGCNFDEKPALLSGLAYEYFNQKYTKALYNNIGKHIWDWCD